MTHTLTLCVFQEPAPMTEDLLEEQSEVLAKLGTSAEGTHLRARMQSACLLSDMESFKVRRPHCLIISAVEIIIYTYNTEELLQLYPLHF